MKSYKEKLLALLCVMFLSAAALPAGAEEEGTAEEHGVDEIQQLLLSFRLLFHLLYVFVGGELQ